MKNPLGLPPACQRCPALVRSRSQVVHGYGRPRTDLMLVGNAPGRGGADATGVPFTGDHAGRRFLWLLQELGRYREGDRRSHAPQINCYVTNAIRCATPGGRPPRKTELESCRDYLAEEILRVDPLVIVPIGRNAGQAVYDLVADEPFPGAREAHGTSTCANGYRIHPMSHLSRIQTEELRSLARRLVRVAVHSQPGSNGKSQKLTHDVVDHIAFRLQLACNVAHGRALRATGKTAGRDYWLARMETFARLALAAPRDVRLRDGMDVPEFTFLAERGDAAYLRPRNGNGNGGAGFQWLQVAPTPTGVFEYWLLQRYFWDLPEALLFPIVGGEATLRRILEPLGRIADMGATERRKAFPPAVQLSGDHADLTVLVHRPGTDPPELRLDTVRIDMNTGRSHYVERRTIATVAAPPGPRDYLYLR